MTLPFPTIEAITKGKLTPWRRNMLAAHLTYEGVKMAYDNGADYEACSGIVKQLNAAVGDK